MDGAERRCSLPTRVGQKVVCAGTGVVMALGPLLVARCGGGCAGCTGCIGAGAGTLGLLVIGAVVRGLMMGARNKRARRRGNWPPGLGGVLGGRVSK